MDSLNKFAVNIGGNVLRRLKPWQLILLYLSVFFAWILSAYALSDFGISYATEGGSAFFKIHIYSYILLIITASILVNYGINGFINPLGQLKRIWIFMFFSVAWLIGYGLYRQGMSGMAYAVDTLLTPLLCMPIALRLNSRQSINMLRFVSALILVNALIALLEFYLSHRIWSVEFKEFGSHFRSTALMGHPLNNALITCSLALILARYSRLGMALYLFITGMALFAFGARGATAVCLAGGAVFAVHSVVNLEIKRSQNSQILFSLIPFAAIIFGAVITYFLMYTNLSNRIFSSLYIDASANTRLDVFALLNTMNSSDLLFGANADLTNNFNEIINNSVIENFVIGWIFSSGIIGAGFLIVSFLIMMYRLVVISDFVGKIAIISFSFAALTNNSLSTKTPALLLLLFVVSISINILSLQNSSNNLAVNKNL